MQLLLTTLVCAASVQCTPIKVSQPTAVTSAKAAIKTTTAHPPLPPKPVFPRTELLAPEALEGPQYYYQNQQPNPSKNVQSPGRVEATQYSSYEQYFKEQEQVPSNDFLSQHQPEDEEKESVKTKTTEGGQQLRENEWYGYYKPTKEEEKKFFIDLLPPSENQKEPNYYSAYKPRKYKKASKDGKQTKEAKDKQINKKEIEGYPAIEFFTEEDAVDEASATVTPLFPETEKFLDHIAASNNIPKKYVLRPPAPTLRAGALRSSELNTGEYFIDDIPDAKEFPKELKHLKEFRDVEPAKKIIKRTASPVTEATLEQDENTRYNFQMHGNDGPKTYKFGFDTGKG